MRPPGVDPLSFDLGRLVQRSVVSLYSSLVTRPTGRAVRFAIEARLGERSGGVPVSLIDLSRVSVLDFSCADEVVAKLLLRHSGGGVDPPAVFLLHGLSESHRGPIEAALERQGLAVVARTASGSVELLGTATSSEADTWSLLEERLVIRDAEADGLAEPVRTTLSRLAARGLAYREPASRSFHALSGLVPPPDPSGQGSPNGGGG